MAELPRPDLCIVGAGALGIDLAQHASRLGAEVLLVDRGHSEPGDGPENALRLARLQAVAAQVEAQRQGARLGLPNTEAKINFRAIQERVDALVTEIAPATSEDRLAALGIQVLRGEPRFTDTQTLLIGETQVKAGTTILALGPMPTVPPIPGLDQIGAFTPESILTSTRKLSHLLVIGGDPSAFALAQVFSRLGSDVTLVPQGPALPGFDPEAVAILFQLLAAEGITVLDGGAVSAIQPRSQGIGAIVDLPSGEQKPLDISHVLVAMGGTADLAPLDRVAARLRPQRGGAGLLTDELGQTGNRRIRLVGAAAGIDQWQHAQRHGRAVVESVLLGAPRSKIAPQPRLVLTDPPLAQIGRSTNNTGKPKPGSGIFRASFAENHAALAAGRGQGLVKVLAGADGTIQGASLVGPGASDMAAVLGLAMQQGLNLAKLAELSLPHPSLMTTISDLGVNYLASRPVSPWTARRRALRRIIPL
ncbi:FAD-dependent oxidoreductase [Devosia rhizoryzae]|uniref:NAD(P)/FAD-dependent oxidoreductase n=1 Tax=Devosia rhizoryzae TaxID=2774137 RepID=A0ABX7C6J6_9HYPH|nr:FAD-dependent oxidoreductase [Devosia rhizoryzae]QQR39726.1 NAD(P)/FAD-dependent oxidoreductase [Devosia rhizoryzae]